MLLDDIFWYFSTRFGKRDEKGQLTPTAQWVVGVLVTLLVIYVIYKLGVMLINDD